MGGCGTLPVERHRHGPGVRACLSVVNQHLTVDASSTNAMRLDGGACGGGRVQSSTAARELVSPGRRKNKDGEGCAGVPSVSTRTKNACDGTHKVRDVKLVG